MICRKCVDLVESRSQVVSGYGNKKAAIMFVGICPGNHLGHGGADSTGIPFKGDASGRLFERLLSDLELTREDVYTTNIVKCRPAKPDDIRFNRLPTEQEMINCFPSLLIEIYEVQPKIIICFGKIVYDFIYRHNSLEVFEKIKIVYCYHPAFLARCPSKYMTWMNDVKSKIKKSKKSLYQSSYSKTRNGKLHQKINIKKYQHSKKGKIVSKKAKQKYVHSTKGKLNRLNHIEKIRVKSHLHKLFDRYDLINEDCAICNSSQSIERHHPNYDLWFHIYFLCQNCHNHIHELERRNVDV